MGGQESGKINLGSDGPSIPARGPGIDRFLQKYYRVAGLMMGGNLARPVTVF
jgi:hypothetical protein